jgi:hypothetical protein
LNSSKVVLPASVVLISLAAASFCYFSGILNLHYDGVAHLNIARRIIDHPVPHYSHLGTVWLPLQHLLLLPWVQSDFLWSQGLAGTIVSVSAFWAACFYLFRLSVSAHSNRWAGFLSVAAFVLNPNVLYLQSTPLGETLYIALLLASTFQLVRLLEQPGASVLPAAITVALASLARYDGWLLVPWGTFLLILAKPYRQENWKSRCWRVSRFLLVASLGIGSWLLYNQIAFQDPLAFTRSEYSTRKNIRQIVAEAGLSAYPPFENASTAFRYYVQAALWSVGLPLAGLGCLGFALFARRNWAALRFWALAFCFIVPPVFYIANMIRGTGIIYVPALIPYGILNVRYTGLFLPGLCLFVPGGVEFLFQGWRFLIRQLRSRHEDKFAGEPVRRRFGASVLAGLLFFWSFQAMHGKNTIAFYQEARVNGLERKQCDFQAAEFLRAHHDGERLLMDVSQHGIIPQQCRIALINTINEATDWDAALRNPSLFVSWIVVQDGDGVSNFPLNWTDVHRHFDLVFRAEGPFEKPLSIYRKSSKQEATETPRHGE